MVSRDPDTHLKFCGVSQKHPDLFFGRSSNSRKIILLNEPEQTKLIKHNFDNEHHHFTFKYSQNGGNLLMSH